MWLRFTCLALLPGLMLLGGCATHSPQVPRPKEEAENPMRLLHSQNQSGLYGDSIPTSGYNAPELVRQTYMELRASRGADDYLVTLVGIGMMIFAILVVYGALTAFD